MRFCSVCIGTQFARFRATSCVIFFFFNDTATTEIYTLSLHDALPIYPRPAQGAVRLRRCRGRPGAGALRDPPRAGGAREIGRASCRERVEISVVAVSLKKKKLLDFCRCFLIIQSITAFSPDLFR